MNIKCLLIGFSGLLILSCNTGKQQVTDTVELTNTKDSVSYVIGMQMGENFIKQELTENINFEALVAGLNEQIEGKGRLDLEASNEMVNQYFMKLQEGDFAETIAAGEAFLEEKAKEPGVKKTASGLMYKVIKEGTGSIPSEQDMVKTHYRGTLISGEEFDSSYSRGEPAVFPVNGVIPGWVEALQMMKEGAKWELYIPYNLAYGERGAGGLIGPYETLIFEIELISIEN
ncbi:MAG TPA: FKBP-type peptidyl-prolyl cis-trans isomerase [Bacteroidales bacterium]|jgi:FKBP-type peptidyl-prolyl cis-trans isomerase FklB|nr:FKBP-type peptidyl-prolyl cis-trans isomerase [Bacteroidales bacterium]HXK82375.1 FKBP-type peptidyl-prolyl cis-trans isomerase [Bacteroidales bacterium]